MTATDVDRITWLIEDPDDEHEPDLATADPVPEDSVGDAPVVEGDI